MTLYRALLLLYPASFRAEYGEQLCAAFEERLRTSGARAYVPAFFDVLANAAGAHFDILKQDLRYAGRTLRRSPGFALTAVLVVALGIGANTAAFSLANFVLIRPLPFPHSERLIKIWSATQEAGRNENSPAFYREWKTQATKSIAGMAAYNRSAANLVGRGSPVRLQIIRATPDLLPLIGVKAHLGTIITPQNAANGDVAVLSHDLWQTQFGGDPRAIGQVVRLDGRPHMIVGVMPKGYSFPSRETQLWTSLRFAPDAFEDRSDTYLEIIGRLAPGATLASARAELATVSARMRQQHPEDDPWSGAVVYTLRDDMSQSSRLLIVALCGAAICVFVLACANLASLLLARGMSRMRELSIRTALGAGRERLIRQLLTESVVLGLAGAAAGIAIANAGLPLLARLVPTALPLADVPNIDVRVLAIAAMIITLTGLGFGVIPSLRAPDMRRRRIRSSLVVIEITGSVVLLISSGLLMRAIWKIQGVPTGFRTEGVTTLRTALPLPKYEATATRERFYRRVLDDVRAIPGVESAAYTTGLPMVKTGGIWPVLIDGMDKRTGNRMASVRYVTAGYFKTLSIPLVAGREILDTDSGDRPYVTVVSESLARRFWPGRDPIGRKFKIAAAERVVVGVVADVRVRGLERMSEPQVYLPSGQVPDNSIIGYIPQDLVVRARVPSAQWLPAVRRIIAAADPEQPVSNVMPVDEIVANDTASRRVQLRLLAILSAIALLIAGVGVHGLLSFAVAQRTKEFGIRRALGAEAKEIVSMVLRDGVRLVVTGTAIGVLIGLYVGRAMNALLFGVPPTDPLTFVAAVTICAVTALIGCMRPAMRAGRVDPMIALREA